MPYIKVSSDNNPSVSTGSRIKSNYMTADHDPNSPWNAGKNEQWTSSRVLGNIYKLYDLDQERARKMYSNFKYLQTDPSSKYYNPYSTATNKSVAALNAYGIDTSNINDDWYNQYSYLNQYLHYDGTSNTPSKPGKKASDAEKAAYEFYQVWKSEKATKKAEEQWEALQKDITYWTQRSDRNLSNDEILGKIDWSKYGELKSMDDNAMFQPNEYNRAIGYSKDALYGVIWEARNPGYNGDLEGAMAYSYLGRGNQYQYNPEIASKLDPTNPNYNPYSLGSTDLDEEAAYFNTPYFAQDWCSKHAYLLNGSDEDKRYYQKVYKAEQDTLQGEQARDALYKWIENYEGSDYEKAQKAFDRMLDKNGEVTVRVGKEKYKVNFSVLNAMDLSMGKNGSDPNGQVVALTRGIDYKYSDALRMLQERCDQNAKKQNDIGYIEENSGSEEPKSSVPETDISKDGAAVSAGLPGSNEIDAISSADKVVKAPEQNIQSDSVPEPETKRQAKPPVKPITLPDQANEIIKKKNQNVSDGIELAGPSLTDQEINTLGTYSASSGEVKEFMKTVPTSDLLNNNTAQTAIDFAGGMVKTSVGYVTYGNALAKLPSVEAELSALTTAVSATQDELNALNDLKELTSSPYVPDWLTADMYALQNNPENSQAYLDALVDIRKQVTGFEYNEGEFNFNQAKDWADYIFNNDREMVETAYEGDKDSRIKDLQQEQMVLQQQKDQNKNAYGEYEQKNLWFDATIAAYEEQGLDTSELLMARAVSDYLTDMATYQPTVWSSQSYYDDLSAEGKTRQEIDQIHSDQATLLENAKFVKEYVSQNGIDMPEEIAKNLDRYIAALERDELDYQYYSLKFNDDFGEKVAAGIVRENEEKLKVNPGSNVVYDPGTKGTEIEVMAGLDKAEYFALMNDDEVKTYYYLYGTEGRAAAYEYYKHLTDDTYGILNTRQTEQIEEAAKKEVDAGFLSGGLANFKAILSSAPEAILGLAYMIDRAITQEEYNPNAPALSFGHYSSAVNEATMESILACCGKDGENGKEHTLWSKAVSGLYEIIYNRGRSAVNAAVFNFFGPDSAVPDIVKELVGASPMAFGAASMAIANAKDKGASDGQAYTIGMATLLSESLSEAITMSNIREAFGAGDISAHGFKEAVIKWLTQDGVEEMFGESVTDIVENLTDEMVMGELSDHAERVRAWKEKDPRLSDEEAELLARQDEVAGVLHTALISYLSPGLDLTAVAYRSAHEQLSYYRYETRRRQRIGDPTNLMQVRRQYQEAKKNGTLYKPGASRKAPSVQSEVETRPQVAPLGTQIKFVNGVPEGKLLSRDIALMQSVINSVPSTKNDAISQVLNGENATAAQSDEADAAASNVSRFFGGDLQKTAEGIKTIVTGAYAAGIKNEVVKQAVKTASLSESSQASKVMSSEEFQSATPEQKAQMLADTVEKDSLNSTVQSEVENSVYENRIAKAEGDLIANGALASLKPLQVTVDAANSAVSEAQKMFNSKGLMLNEATKAYSEAAAEVDRASAALEANPTDENAKALQQAVNELGQAGQKIQAADESALQYEQHLNKSKQNLEQVEGKLNDALESAMADIRQQAQDAVAQQDQQRADEAAALAEQQRLAQGKAVRQQAEEDERTGKAQEERDAAAIEAIADSEKLEGVEREQRTNELDEQQKKVKFKLRDLKKPVSDAEGMIALGAFERKLGIKIQLEDLGPITKEGWTRGQYVVDKKTGNAFIRLNKNMSIGQALVEAALHEITHSMQGTGAYKSYRNIVLESVFKTKFDNAFDFYNSEEGDKSGFHAMVDQIKSERLAANDQNFVGKSLEDQVQAAEEEIIADFARANLAEKEVVQRFMDAGLGGKMRNMLHNINQALKNYFGNMSDEERKTAEYLRRAERAYQKAINQVAKQSVHPEANQFSIMQIAQATGMTFNENTLQLFDQNGNEIDGVNRTVTPEMIQNTPVAMLINNGLSDQSPGVDENGNQIDSPRVAATKMMAGLMNMVARYKDSNLVWEIGATTLNSTFSALKSNSDPQYKTTVDFGTVCAKTQAIIDTLSQVMLDKVANGEYGGLTRKDIMKVYDAVNKAGLSVPCPVCYVFSRWMGVPSLLGQMSQYQHDFVVTDENGKIDKKATQKKVDQYIKNAEKLGDAKAINNKKTQLQNKRTAMEENRVNLEKASREKNLTTEEKANIQKQLDNTLDQLTDLDNQIGELSAYNWITQALCKKDKNGKYVVDDKFQLTPDEVLFDLNKTGEFAKYEKNWRYRNTRGAGMGKAIMPYSGETIGDILYGVKKGGRQNSIRNPWLNMDDKAAARQLREARARAIKQNLVGGQRLQSTSDFRPEWGLDYIMSFLELQAAGSKVQMYTKVSEAVDFFASVGADVNLSIMGRGTGWHEATADEIAAMTPDQRERATIDGKVYVLDFSDVTGMKYGTAVDLKNKYDNVQMILVGMNDTHIRLAMANSDIDFIIPWHSSGNSKDVLAGLISAVGEKLDSSVDYTTTQSDMVKGTVKKYTDENGNKVEYTVPGQQTEAEKALWDARMKLLTKGGDALTLAERKVLLANPITADLYKRFTQKGVDPDCYGVKLSKEQASQIFPYEYWDTTSTKENADVNGKRFVEYCEAMGIVPRFSQFKDDIGYWKLLIDRPMYNNDGSYHQQQVIDVTNARIGDLNESGELVDSDLPTQAQAKYAPKDPRNPNYEQYTEAQKQAVENAEAAIREQYDDGTTAQNSIYGFQTEADREVMRQAEEDYQAAVERGDMEAAQEAVDYAAEQAGYTTKAYHGTTRQFNAFRFTGDDLGIHLGTKGQARMMAGRGKNARIIEAYVKLENPIHFERDLGAWEGKRVAKELYDMGIITEQEAANALLSPDRSYRLSDERATKNIRDLLISKGYDGFVYDNDFEGYSKKSQQSIAVFNPNQIKLAAPVTYDAQGNVIPLSQRFSDSADIRYSELGILTEADRQVMRNAGLDVSAKDRVNRQDVQKTDVESAMDSWDGISLKSARDLRQMMPNSLYSRIEPFIRNVYYKQNGAVDQVIPKSEILKFLEKDQIDAENGADSIIEGWQKLVSENREPLTVIDLDSNQSTWSKSSKINGTSSERIAKVLFPKAKKIIYNEDGTIACGDFENDDLKATLRINKNTITETLHWFGERRIPFVAAEKIMMDADVLLKNAKYIGSREDYLPENKGQNIHYLVSPAKENGSNKAILFTLHDVPQKSLGYNEHVYTVGMSFIAEQKQNGGPQDHVGSEAQTMDLTAETTSNVTIADVLRSVNTDRIRFYDKELISGKQALLSSTGGIQTEADQAMAREAELNQTLVEGGALTAEEVQAYEERYHKRPLEGRRATEGDAVRAFGDVGGMLEKSDEISNFAKSVVKAQNTYFPDSNFDQINRAIDWIKNIKGGYAEALNKVISDSFDYRSADGQARMVAMMGLAAAKDDVLAQASLADAFMRQGTDLGRALQARKLFMLMTPEGRISSLNRMLQNAKDEIGKQGKNVDLKFSEWVYQAAAAAETEEDMRLVRKAALSELSEQLPANWKDRLNSLRMLSMLANPRTHIRNIIGNAMFIPAVSLKNKLGAVMELGVKQGEKTKTLKPVASKEARAFAREDAEAIKGLLTGEAKYSEGAQIKQNQAPLGQFMKALSDLNSKFLEGEDWFFLKGHYRRALSGWMEANGYTADQLRENQALLEKGRTYAINEAQKATYRDFSKTAQTLNQVSRKGGIAGFIVDAALPFKKTPANILRRGIEYSPAGIVKSLTYDMVKMKQYLDYQNGKLNVLPEKAMSPTQVIDDLCSGLSGTAITALGFLLAGSGAVSCGLDDDEDKFEKAKGNQEYAINPGKALNTLFNAKLFGEDVTFTMDWAAPMSMPFFVGAAIREQMEKEGDVNVEEVLNALGGITEPVFNLSMLDGINTLFKTSSYDNTNPITQIGSKIATNYASSFVPSLFGAIAKTIDTTRRKSFVEQGKSSGVMGNIRYAFENAQNKIPFYNQENIPVRDIWGNEETTGLAERILENFILPGYINEYNEDPIINEMARLYDSRAEGYKSMIPQADPDKKITYTVKSTKEKVEHVLTDKEWDKYKEVRNKTAYAELTALLNNPDYQNATDASQIQMIKNIWSHADKVGQKAVIPDIDVDESNDGTVAAIAKDSKISSTKNEMIKALNAGDYDTFDTMVQALYDEGLEESDVRAKIRDYYRDQYKDAYRKGLEDRMLEIEDILDNTGIDFTDLIYSWQDAVDEEKNK